MEKLVISEVVEPDAELIKRLREAEQNNKIVAIVVDTWSLLLQVYRGPMLEYDRLNFLNCVVLVAWNDKDDELTETQRSELMDVMQTTFPRNFFKRDRTCFLETNSHTELMKELSTVLSKARARIREHGEVMRKAESDKGFDRPPRIRVVIGRASA
jgi:FxsC-like protein